MERSIKGDYIGFTFGDAHSSELGLVRVSDGSRYNTDLLPPLEDKVAQVAGRDGEVLFGTTYKAKEIKVPVAFDNMTEESFRRLIQLLADKKPKSLWYDESPYKEWIVKSANAQDFKWVCFDESHNGKEKRIYKGEGTLVFKCRSPYAQSRVTYLDDPVPYVYVKDGHRIIKKEKVLRYWMQKGNSLQKLSKLSENVYKDDMDKNYNFELLEQTIEEKLVHKNFSLALPLDKNYSKIGVIGIMDSQNNKIIKKSNIYRIDLNKCRKDERGWHIIGAENIFTGETDILTLNNIKDTYFFEGKVGNVENQIINIIYQSNYINPSIFMDLTEEELQEDKILHQGKVIHYVFSKETDCTLEDNYNFEEWKDASGLVLRNGYENFSSVTNQVMNSGDMETDFILTVSLGENSFWEDLIDPKEKKVDFIKDITNNKILTLHKLEKIESDCIQFDSKNKLIKGGTYNEKDKKFIPDGKIYNFLIKSGDFFHLDVGLTSFIVIPISKKLVNLIKFEHKHHYYI